MSNEWGSLFVASYDNIPLAVLAVDDTTSRDVVVTTYPRTDGGFVDDQGQAPRETRWRILFFPDGSLESHIDRFIEFHERLQDGQSHTLVHPLTGSFEARPTEIGFSASGGDRNAISMEVTFVESTVVPAVFEAGEESQTESGVQAVSTSAAELDTAVSAAGLSSDIGGDARTLADAWEAKRDTITGRELAAGLNEFNNDLNDEMDALECATNLDRYPIMVALNRLASDMNKLASSHLSNTRKIVKLVTKHAEPLVSICQRYYGASEAPERAEQILKLNRITTPHLIPAGTELDAFAAGTPLVRKGLDE